MILNMIQIEVDNKNESNLKKTNEFIILNVYFTKIVLFCIVLVESIGLLLKEKDEPIKNEGKLQNN
jgi:hypothetical protein